MHWGALTIVLLLLPQQPQRLGTARIEGTVLREGTTEPVSGARITVTRVNAATGANVPTAGTLTTYLINPNPNAPPPNPPPAAGTPGATPQAPQPAPIPAVITDRAGKFVVTDLEEGAYRVAVTLNGYVKQEYGQRSFAGQGVTLNLRKDDVLKDLVVRLTRAGNISGRIIDDTGQPATGVPLQLLKVTYNQNGQRIFTSAGTARTNDRGEYRLYWLTPGRYYLAGGTPSGPPAGATPGGPPSPNESGDTFVFTYYPGTTDLSRATSIEVKPGSDMAMDFVVPRTQLFNISGRIVAPLSSNTSANTTTPVAPAVNISLAFATLTGGSAFIQMTQSYDPATGNFMLRNVVPGSYALQANSGNAMARTQIELTNADLTNITLTLNGGVNIAGRVQMDAGAALPSAPVRIQLRPLIRGTSNFVGFAPGAQAAADGTFRYSGVLGGEYRAVVLPVPGYYVKEMKLDRTDALNATIHVPDSAPSEPLLELLLSPNVAQIDGTVTDERNQPLPGVQAVLVPDKNRDRPDIYKSGVTDQSGRFTMKDVAPGDYKLFAWDGLDGFAYFDQDFVRRYDSQGKAVHVDESAKIVVDTKVIPDSAR